jgi:hypothetical protein
MSGHKRNFSRSNLRLVWAQSLKGKAATSFPALGSHKIFSYPALPILKASLPGQREECEGATRNPEIVGAGLKPAPIGCRSRIGSGTSFHRHDDSGGTFFFSELLRYRAHHKRAPAEKALHSAKSVDNGAVRGRWPTSTNIFISASAIFCSCGVKVNSIFG